MKLHAPKVKSRVVPCWTGASRVNSWHGWHSPSVMSSNARKTLRRDPDGQHEHVHCSATARRKCIETGCVVEQRPTDGLKRLQEPNSRDPQITGTTPSDAEKMGALQNSAKTVMACTATAKNLSHERIQLRQDKVVQQVANGNSGQQNGGCIGTCDKSDGKGPPCYRCGVRLKRIAWTILLLRAQNLIHQRHSRQQTGVGVV